MVFNHHLILFIKVRLSCIIAAFGLLFLNKYLMSSYTTQCNVIHTYLCADGKYASSSGYGYYGNKTVAVRGMRLLRLEAA